MKRRILIREAARRDLRESSAFIAEGSREEAGRFIDAAERSFKKLAGMPAMGVSYDAIAPALKGMRRFRVEGFEDYLIFYFPLNDGVEVVRVIHGARDLEEIFKRSRE